MGRSGRRAAISCSTSYWPGTSRASFKRVVETCTNAGSCEAAPHTMLYSSSGEMGCGGGWLGGLMVSKSDTHGERNQIAGAELSTAVEGRKATGHVEMRWGRLWTAEHLFS